MGTVIYFLLCSFVVVLAQDEVEFETDMPFFRVKVYNKADLRCCYRHKSNIDPNLKPSWHKKSNMTASLEPVTNTGFVTQDTKTEPDKICGILNFKLVKMEDNGLYQCMLNSSTIQRLSHGTYLQVYQPLEKTINIGENTKNKILTAEGILLFLCVILPAAALLCQSKKLNELERKKMKKEEENIYQGLNLDDCCSTYDQIERSQAHGPYQDVCNIMEEEEEIQLEKP